jgi:putative endonuclease
MYYVYVICDSKGKSYIGYTDDLEKRLESHNKGLNKSTNNREWELVYYEAYKSKQDAMQREKRLKRSGQARRWLKDRIKTSITLGRDR